MTKALRLSEKWYTRGLWLVALVFAGFLMGLGSSVVRQLPLVEHRYQREDFVDAAQVRQLRQAIRTAQDAREDAKAALDREELALARSQEDYNAAVETFNNWVRSTPMDPATGRDRELAQRSQAMDRLKTLERSARGKVETQQGAELAARQGEAQLQTSLNTLLASGADRQRAAERQQELRVFLYRLLLTLPLLGLAVWLLVRKRKGPYWPFVWGFAFFAGFTFFVELVPYLPSYGGYVRSIVGIVLTVLVGRKAILSLQRYLELQKAAEQLPAAQRREELGYEVALQRLAKGVCPGCERPVALKDPAIDFCPHCGIHLHEPCTACAARKDSFAPFCHACGAPAH